MPVSKKAKNSDNKKKITLRFFDEDHHSLVQKACKRAKLTMNGWLINATVAKAREELGIK